MRKALLVALLWLCSVVGTTTSEAASAAEDSLDSVKQALVRNICFDVYWWGSAYPMGTSLSLEVKTERYRFYAFVEDPTKKFPMSYFYAGRIKEGTAAVIYRNGYNVSLTPLPGVYLEDRRHFDKDVIKETLVTPTDCTPNYDPPTRQKERMVKTVVSTMQKELSWLVRAGFVKFQKEATILIADFNVDYLWTHILVDRPRERYMYTVTLHDSQDYDSDWYEREGQYPFKSIRIEPGHKNLLAKIRKHGIVRKIILTP